MPSLPLSPLPQGLFYYLRWSRLPGQTAAQSFAQPLAATMQMRTYRIDRQPKSYGNALVAALLLVVEHQHRTLDLGQREQFGIDRTLHLGVGKPLLGSAGVESVDLVKIDVQGFEGHVLKGMTRTIQRSNNLILLTEFWPFGLHRAGTSPMDVLMELERAGLRLHELTEKGRLEPLTDKERFIERHGGRKYANIVAMRAS